MADREGVVRTGDGSVERNDDGSEARNGVRSVGRRASGASGAARARDGRATVRSLSTTTRGRRATGRSA